MNQSFIKNLFNSSIVLVLLLTQTGCNANANSKATSPTKSLPTASDMDGKVYVGYQGWYRTPTDGAGMGWEHYETYEEEFTPGKAGIDFWPDMSELSDHEKFATDFKYKDGSTAYVFSSENATTVNRHFQWMREHNIDGAFLQRFTLDVTGFHHQSHLLRPSNDRVLSHVQKSANAHQRAYAIMYDLSGMPHGEMKKVIKDWKELNDIFDLRHDPAYIKNKSKPLVAIWGVGFSDGRKYTLDEVAKLIEFFKNDPDYGGCSILLGLPTYWRTLQNDAVSDAKFHEIIKTADVILPWTVGRFGGSKTALKRGKEYVQPDFEWCKKNNVQYMPLAFPGFSWGNRYSHENAKFDHIPREDGLFLWSQAVAAKRAGAQMLYVAMFDEMDEGTQIFKVSNKVPEGNTFLTYKPHEPDYYLRLTGKISELMKGEIKASDSMPNF
ncbi:MAG: glycoside hydrolase family 71/99-like protein [Verrucomicrobiota bacterium]